MHIILNRLLAISIVSTFLISCGGHDHKEGHEHGHEHDATNADGGCELTYSADSTKMSWTAYKTTEKVGVSGTFDKVDISGTMVAATAPEVFANAKFNISAATVNSANPDRDKKISEHFFGTMVSTIDLTGEVEEIGNNYAVVLITMNGVTMKQKFNLETDNASYCTIVANLDLNNWNAQQSINALNEICFDLHKGADGESKLWSEVRVELVAPLQKDCP